MTPQERKKRYFAARAKRFRESAPDNFFPNVMSAEELATRFGLVEMAPDVLAALRAMPGGDCFDPEDEQPPVDEFGEPEPPGAAYSPR